MSCHVDVCPFCYVIITSLTKRRRFEDSVLTENSAEINFQYLMSHAQEKSFGNFTKYKSALLFHSNCLEDLDSRGVRIRELSLIHQLQTHTADHVVSHLTCTGGFIQESKDATAWR
jgi:hypothetical protein